MTRWYWLDPCNGEEYICGCPTVDAAVEYVLSQDLASHLSKTLGDLNAHDAVQALNVAIGWVCQIFPLRTPSLNLSLSSTACMIICSVPCFLMHHGISQQLTHIPRPPPYQRTKAARGLYDERNGSSFHSTKHISLLRRSPPHGFFGHTGQARNK